MSIVTVSILVAISIIAIVILTSTLKLKAFVALFIVSIFLAFTTLPAASVISTIKEGFGKNRNYPPAEEIETINHYELKKLPSAFLSFLPIAAPLLHITFKSLITLFDKEGIGLIYKIFRFPGDPVFVLATGVIFALLLLKEKTIGSINSVFSEAIEKAGPILIVTAAGGMFGMVIKATGIGEEMGKILAGTGLGLLVPFLIAVVMKTAQGSSTVAIITAASFVLLMLQALGLNSEWGRMLAMLSMGAGSMVVSHANDSYFWVISNFSGLNINTTLRVYSSSTIVMGITVFTCI